METAPESGGRTPARTSRSVDLPEPLGPINPRRSPSEIDSERSSNKRFAPNEAVNAWELSRRGMKNIGAADGWGYRASVTWPQAAEFKIRRVPPPRAQVLYALPRRIPKR